ncbi:MAG: hypothetical protein ABIV13_06525 [Fimbriimonadales bacterium]
MWDRRFLFSDNRIIEQLQSFIPYAGNTHNLQWRRSPESNWFMDTVRKINARADKNETVQGFYVINAVGDAYGFNNNRNVQIVLDFMRSKLLDYNNSPQEIVHIDPSDDGIPDPPEGATVLRVHQRIMPVPKDANFANQNVQRDHFWLLKDEKSQLLKGIVPDSLGLRLCRFVFNDAVRGEPDMWTVGQVRKCDFTATQEGNTVTLRGEFAMHTEDSKRGIEGKLTAVIDFKNAELTNFRGIADTHAWGRSTHTPGEPPGRFPLKFALVVSPKDYVAPQGSTHGNSYLTGR